MTVSRVLDRSALRRPDAEAVVDRDERLTYGELRRLLREGHYTEMRP